MQQHIDAPELMARVGEVAKEIRKSEAYPALVGGIAGGVAGALIAGVIAGRATARGGEPTSNGAKESRGGWNMRDLVQLLTITVTLARQVQAWMKEQEQPK
jgi:hypothetical protein